MRPARTGLGQSNGRKMKKLRGRSADLRRSKIVRPDLVELGRKSRDKDINLGKE